MLKDAIVLVIYKIIYLIVRLFPAKPGAKHLIIIKTDEIGDYMLVRAILPYFRKSEEFKNHRISFIGNRIFRQIYERYDRDVANEAIWIDKWQFRKNLGYRFRMLRQIRKLRASDVVNLVYSGNYRLDDAVADMATGITKTTMANLKTGMEKILFDRPKIYNQLLDPGPEDLFDGKRNVFFAERLLNLTIDPVAHQVDAKEDISAFSLPQAYYVVFPGSGNKIRRWPKACFAEVIHHIARHTRLIPVLCGGSGDQEYVAEVKSLLNVPVIDLAGRTTLPEFLTILRHARFLISVDTGALHLAAAAGCPVFGLFSGLFYGRFAPYPAAWAKDFFVIYPDETEEKIRNHQLEELSKTPVDLIKKIPPGKVIRQIDVFLNNNSGG